MNNHLKIVLDLKYSKVTVMNKDAMVSFDSLNSLDQDSAFDMLELAKKKFLRLRKDKV